MNSSTAREGTARGQIDPLGRDRMPRMPTHTRHAASALCSSSPCSDGGLSATTSVLEKHAVRRSALDADLAAAELLPAVDDNAAAAARAEMPRAVSPSLLGAGKGAQPPIYFYGYRVP